MGSFFFFSGVEGVACNLDCWIVDLSGLGGLSCAFIGTFSQDSGLGVYGPLALCTYGSFLFF